MSGSVVAFDTQSLRRVQDLCQRTAGALQDARVPSPALPALGHLPAEAVGSLIATEQQLRAETVTALAALRASLLRTAEGLERADRFVW